MGSTATLALPYPDPSASPDGPYSFQQLAEALDALLSATRPRVSLYLTTAPSLASLTSGTAISFDTELFKVGAMHSTITNPTRITIPKTGLYRLEGSTEFGSDNTTGFRRVQFRANGSVFFDGNCAPATGVSTQVTTSALWQAVAGDYVEMLITQNSGLAKTPVAASTLFKALWECP